MMTHKNQSRLDRLERDTSITGGHVVLYADPDRPDCYWEKYPFGPLESRGKRYSQSEVQALEDERELVIINFVTDWRSNGESNPAFG